MTEGVVLGIDVGYSPKKRTTCFCTLAWDHGTIRLDFRLTTSDTTQRRDALDALVAGISLAGVALDGPLTNGLRLIRNYRAAEALLSRGVLQTRGKPGQTSSGTGQSLHVHASQLAEMVLQHASVAPANHIESISERRIVEAFPNLYLGALVDEAHLPTLKGKRNATDRYWDVLATESETLTAHTKRMLPGRTIQTPLAAIRNHDHRAGVACALTALAVVVQDFMAVGDPSDGDIILPGEGHWGASLSTGSWLSPILRANLASVTSGVGTSFANREARIRTRAGLW